MEAIKEFLKTVWELKADQIAIISLVVTFILFVLGKISENKIKIYMAYGDSDKTVPYEENGIALERAYKANGLENLLYLDKKVGVDHHPHGPTDIDFAIKYFEK